MLISSKKEIADYSAAAGDVRLQIATVRALGHPSKPVTAVERQGIDTIRTLIDLGSRFGSGPTGNLDVTGSTPEEIDLVEELKGLLPAELAVVQTSEGKVDLGHWSKLATQVLDRFREESEWENLTEEQREFVAVELEPFLVKLLSADPKSEDE